MDDSTAGIRREKHGRSFRYVGPNGRPITDRRILDRIRGLVIPPAWTDVWICSDPNGHLQVTGHDAKGRKQYRYHPRWREVRDENKYDRLISFAQALPRIRRRVARDLRRKRLPREKVLAAVIKLLETTLVRVGNDEYAEANKSFGLTTMRDRHVRVARGKVRMEFSGKSGVDHEIDIHDPRLVEVVRKCQELPGQELLQYVDEQGKVHDVGSSDVNDYLREISGDDFTAKDFRTWAGTALAAEALKEFEDFDTKSCREAQRDQSHRARGGTPGKHKGSLPQVLCPSRDRRCLYGSLAARDAQEPRGNRAPQGCFALAGGRGCRLGVAAATNEASDQARRRPPPHPPSSLRHSVMSE